MITGHSERRVGFGEGGESSELVAEKTKVFAANITVEVYYYTRILEDTLQQVGLSVLYCI